MILFDGVCNLCNGFVQFVIERDPSGRFVFASLQSNAARQLLGDLKTPAPLPDSLVLVQDGHVFTRSDAALRIARSLGFPWKLAYGLTVTPRSIRDWAYDLVARNRYKWFGRRESCMIPTTDLRRRFLEVNASQWRVD